MKSCKMFGCFSSPTKRVILAIVAIVSILSGALLLTFHQRLFSSILNSQLVIKEGTAAYGAWVETPIPIFTKFYFFDMLNPRDLFHSHEKPILEERGPYTFREVEKKVNLTWENDGTVSYRRVKYWYFERNMSVGPLTDTVTTINVPVVGSADFVRGDFFMEWGVSDMLSTIQAKIFVKRTISELMFEGYSDPLVEMGSSFLEAEDDFYDGMDYETVEYPKNIPMDKFGWFYERNGTSWSDGDLRMDTGSNGLDNLGKLVQWNHAKQTDVFPGKCGEITGSSDGLFPPGAAYESDTLSIFSTDLCRPLHFDKRESHLIHDIPVYSFQLSPDVFSNSTVCKTNSCYNNNLPTGIQNVTQCKVKSPAFVSRPHFHLADKVYSDQFQYGMSANTDDRYQSYIWIEPRSSIPIKVEMKLQVNILLEKVEGIEYLFKNLPRILFPVFWFESVAEMPEDMSSSIKLLVKLPIMMQSFGYVNVCFGTLILSLIIYYKFQEHKKKVSKSTTSLERSIIKQVEYRVVPLDENIKKKNTVNLSAIKT